MRTEISSNQSQAQPSSSTDHIHASSDGSAAGDITQPLDTTKKGSVQLDEPINGITLVLRKMFQRRLDPGCGGLSGPTIFSTILIWSH